MDADAYSPVEPNYYKFKASEFLQTDNLYDLQQYHRIFICAYDVNNEGVNPFLRYLLTSQGSQLSREVTLGFPVVPPPPEQTENSVYIDYVQQMLLILISQPGKENLGSDIAFMGYYGYNNNMYMFFDITKLRFQPNDIFISNNTWLALVDEILTHHHVCNIPVQEEVGDFFLFNDSFCSLLNDIDKPYEIPLVCYVGKPKTQLSFTCMFGESRSNKNSILGSFYYFFDFYTACKNQPDLTRFVSLDRALTSQPDADTGIVRFAAFLGLSKFIENRPNDPIDASDIKQQRLTDNNLNIQRERLTMRISDHDGKWSQRYNSAFLGDPELDDGTRLNIKLLAITDYNQQIPLSYHYVNRATLKNDNKKIQIA